MNKLIAVLLAVLTILFTAVSCFPVKSDDNSETAAESSNQSTPQNSDQSSQTQDASSKPADTSRDPIDIDNAIDSNTANDSVDTFFDNSVFVGNSIMFHYYNYVTSKRESYDGFMGNAKFFSGQSFSAYNNLQPISADSVHPVYKGDKMKIEDAVAAMGVDTVYLSGMGLNDIAMYAVGEGAQKTVENIAAIIENIKAKSSGVKIVFLANTHLVASFSAKYTRLTNHYISEFNRLMLDYCKTNGYDFVDIATVLVTDGSLDNDFCTDNTESGSGCHLTRNAYAKWTAIMREYAYRTLEESYQSPVEMPLYSK